MTDNEIATKLQNMDQSKFIRDLEVDLVKTTEIARRGDLNFQDPLKAVYHFRKHGEEFPRIIHKHGAWQLTRSLPWESEPSCHTKRQLERNRRATGIFIFMDFHVAPSSGLS